MSKLSTKRIVVIGGGTGSFTLLSSLKSTFPNLTALVNMADDGGSTGILRDELGVLPPGDVRQCLVALSDSSLELRELFNYRFGEGNLRGHSFGNLFLSAAQKLSGNFAEAVTLASNVLNIKGKVVPTTLENCQLVMRYQRKTIKGEFAIANTLLPKGARPSFCLEPEALINPEARVALRWADLIIIAPGNLYGSLAPALVVKGMKEELVNAKAPIIYICNLVNKNKQTKDFAVHDYVDELERIIDSPVIDRVLYNTAVPPPRVVKAYEADDEELVRVDTNSLKQKHYKAQAAQLTSSKLPAKQQNDSLIHRSLIRHDGAKITKLVAEILS